MTPEKREKAIKWLTEEVRSLRLAPKINGCGPENWADLLEIMETSLEAVRNVTEMRPGCNLGEPLTLEQLREMDGKPVYWKNTDLWCLAGAGKIILPTGISYPVRDMPGQFYAYPPAHIDRETWTAEWVDNDQSEEMMCKCSKCGYPVSYFWGKTAFCPGCGKAMTPDAWAELEKRLRG